SNLPYVLNVFSLSDKSVLLQWSKPTQPNGILLGYKIYCSEINETLPGEKINEISYQINDPEKFQAKLTGLQEGVRYLIGISALNCAGESDVKTTEVTLEPHTSAEPFKPKFIYKINYTVPNRDEVCYKPLTTVSPIEEETPEKEIPEYDYYDYLIFNETKKTQIKMIETKPKQPPESDYEKRCIVNTMVLWIPDVRNNPGEHFYLKYRIKGEEEFQVTEPEMSEDYIIIPKFDACRNYEIILTAVDGDYSTDSNLLVTPTKIL
ncbi:neuroglian-like, partial [Asbolus verrucosus]